MRAVLTFHAVDTSDSVLSVAPQQLRSLVQGIRSSGHEIVSLRNLLDHPGNNRVALTFDDGFRSVHDAALPVLRDEGVTASLFLTTGYVGADNGWPTQPAWAPRHPMMDWNQVEALRAAGWDIQAHTANHPDLRALSDEAIRDEMEQADAAIEERLGYRPDQFAYPYGFDDERVRGLARDRYAWCLTTELTWLDGRGDDVLREDGVPRLDTFYVREGRWHRSFGGVTFRAWIGARAALRRLREK